MEQEFQSVPKKFWQTVDPIHKVFSVRRELLNSTESIACCYKEYFEVLLNPTNMLSKEEAEPEDFGLGYHITIVEVAAAVTPQQQCPRGGWDLSRTPQGS